MQQERKAEVKSISLTDSQSIKLLVIFARGISESCQKFAIQFLDLVKNQEQTNRGKISLEYYDLLNKYFQYKKIITPRPLCGKLLNNGQFAFKCFECQNENNSIICIECFNKSDHRGHNYQKIPVVGGCCDCGDDQKWKASGSCTEHNKKQYDIELDKEYTEIFIKQMKFVGYLVFVLNFSIFFKFSKLHQLSLLEGFVTFLTEFNQQSMISNQMTFQLFKSDYTNKYPDVMIDQKKYFLKMNLFSVLTRFYKQKQFARKLVDLFIIMFTRIQFKKYLTCQYNKLISQKASAIISQYSNISCQIYTSHKIIQQLLKQKKFPPIQLAQFDPAIKFDVIADSFARFYIDLTYLSQLYNNIGQKYIEHHFSNSNIVELTSYENYVRADSQFSIQYYGIEYIFFHNRAKQFLRHLLNNKQVLKKTIADVVDYLKALSEHQKLNYYISRQRTLCLLLFMYFDGDIGKAVQKTFLDDIGFSYEILFRILQATLNLIRFYAVNLTNRQTVERYYTFYAFSLLRKPRTLVYLDFQLVKFCLLSLQLYSPTQIDLEYNLQNNTTYIMTIPFSQNLMSLQNLISLPVKFLRKINQTVADTDDGAYDRKKALGFLGDYIGLMNEIVITNHAELNLRNLYLENNEKQMIQFYGNLMKSLKSIKPELFKQVSKIIFGDDEKYFVKFIKQYCVIENKTLKLKPNKEDKFEIINLSYLKSIKNCQIINEQIHENNQKYGLQLYPKLLNQTHETNELRYLIFNATFINDIVIATQDYLEIFSQNQKILKRDIAIFEKFVEEIIKLNYTLKSNKLESLIKDIQQFQHVFQLISQKNRNQIMKCLGQAKITNENDKKETVNEKTQQQKKRMEQLKKKKLQKLKTKQTKALNNHTQCQKSGQKNKMSEQMPQYTPQCMYCKHTGQVQPLFILCFTQKSNLLTQNYLKMDRCVDLITSCNHFVHFSCHKNINKQRKYFYCNFCKTSSNLLVKVQEQNPQEIKEKLIKSKSMEDKGSQKLTLLKRMKKIKSSMFDEGNEKSFEQEEEITEKNQVSEIQKKIQVIAYAILYGVIVDYNFFVKSLYNACGFMLRELAAQTSVIKIQNLINQLEDSRVGIEFNQDEKIYWETYKFAILTVSSLLVVERDHKGWDIREIQQKLPKKIVQNIITLLTSLKSISGLKILQQTKLEPLSAPLLTQIPEKLSQLSKQMGQCPNCSRITNQIALCMICGFKSCVSCEVKNLTKHAQSHGEASIFIRVDEGLIIYVSILKNRFHIPIYRDFMGNYFILQKHKSDRQDYILDKNEQQKVRTDIIRHRIQQHIRYEQLATNKYSTIHP